MGAISEVVGTPEIRGIALLKFCVMDLRVGVFEPVQSVDASSPEEAALLALGIKGVQGGQNPTRLFCHVYWTGRDGHTNMVSLYQPLWIPVEP